MLAVAAAVLALAGTVIIASVTLSYYAAFGRTVSAVLESDGFLSLAAGFDGDTAPIEQWLTNAESVLDQSSDKEWYILRDGNVIKSSREGGILELTDNLEAVLNGGYSHDGALDFACDIGRGYTVYVRDTGAGLRAQIRGLLLAFLPALIFGVALAALLSFIISKRLTASVKTLEKGAQRMSGGDFTPVRVRSKDEIGNLCRVFNEMGERISADFDALEQKERAQREFVAAVSHELKTPLTVIKSYSETLSSGIELDGETRNKFHGIINDEVDRMSGMVNELLYLSRLEQRPLNVEHVDLAALCKTIADGLARAAAEKGVTVEVTGQGARETDAERVRTVVQNFITNAIKYSEPGGKVAVSVSDGGITVADNGIGIAEADLSHVFERFYRTDKARGRDTGGAGLGLAIAKESADAIGASLSVTSVPHEKTVFSLTFGGENG